MAKSRIVTRKIHEPDSHRAGKGETRGRSARIQDTPPTGKTEKSLWGPVLFTGAIIGLGLYGWKQAGFTRITA